MKKKITKEEWRPVKDLEGLYEVSSIGRVRTCPRILKAFPMRNGGHLQINLGLHRRTYVHRLVAEAFIPIDKKRVWVNHKNSNPTDNRVENLAWCTPGENILHGYRENGRIASASMPVAALFKRKIVARFASRKAAAKAMGVSEYVVKNAIKNKKRIRGYLLVAL